MDGAVITRLGVVELLPGHHLVANQSLHSFEGHAGVFEIAPAYFEVSRRLGNLFGAGAVESLVEPGLEHGQIALGLLQLRLVFVVFQAHDGLPLLDAVALLDPDPFHAADHFGRHFDFVRGHDISGGVEDNALRNTGGVQCHHALYLDFGGGVNSLRSQPPGAQRDENEHAADDPARGPLGRPGRVAISAVDLEVLQIRVHNEVIPPSARSGSLFWKHYGRGTGRRSCP